MSEFIRAYIEAALWSSNDDDGPLDSRFDVSDLAEETLSKMTTECEAFLKANAIPDYDHPKYSDAELAGHDFWLSRNRHGSGFWDRNLGPIGETLTEASHSFGEVDLYVGDDGKVHQS